MCLGDIRFNRYVRWSQRRITITNQTELVPAQRTRVGLILPAVEAATMNYTLTTFTGVQSGLIVTASGSAGVILTYAVHGTLTQQRWIAEFLGTQSINLIEAFAPAEIMDFIESLPLAGEDPLLDAGR
jgi:hypothetical protein